jgi:hypothetical protein
MRNARVWLFATLAVAVLAGAAVLSTTEPSAVAQEKVVVNDHWRNHDGHWSYWSDADRR